MDFLTIHDMDCRGDHHCRCRTCAPPVDPFTYRRDRLRRWIGWGLVSLLGWLVLLMAVDIALSHR